MMTDEAIEDHLLDLVDEWHAGHGKGQPLHEYLGMTQDQYDQWMPAGELPRGYTPPQLAAPKPLAFDHAGFLATVMLTIIGALVLLALIAEFTKPGGH
jgi:hypothetical protein